jgi:hypothetical protein
MPIAVVDEVGRSPGIARCGCQGERILPSPVAQGAKSCRRQPAMHVRTCIAAAIARRCRTCSDASIAA